LDTLNPFTEKQLNLLYIEKQNNFAVLVSLDIFGLGCKTISLLAGCSPAEHFAS